jgi:prepilin-type N-terminal cleavage/methylation domain-containing protein
MNPNTDIHNEPGAEPSKGQNGFTLLEVVIALVIMMIAALGAAVLYAYAINYNSGAYDRTLAHAVAQRQLESLRRVSFSNLVTPAQPEPDIVSAGRSFGIVTTVCSDASCGGSATLKKITIQITPRSAGAIWVRSALRIDTLRAVPTTGDYY